MKHFLLFLSLCCGVVYCQDIAAQNSFKQDRRAADVMNDFKLQTLGSMDSMKREFKRGMGEMQKTLSEVQVKDGKIIAGKETIDIATNVQKMSDGVAAIGKVFDIPTEDLRQAQTAIQTMPLFIEQGIELLKNLDLFNEKSK